MARVLVHEMKDPARTCVAPASLPAYARYAGMTRYYMRGEVIKHVVARLGKSFDHAFGLAFGS